ncbi:MAG: glycyl-radical enzyme activating protein, partial [Eubacteriales bacterium]|nr:glycyl-radical enzyme activating protein [Eubacteriales bacterium]
TKCGKCTEVCGDAAIKCGNVDYSRCTFCGKCEIYCPNSALKICGMDYTEEELFEIINKDKIFYENSGGGVTFSGGECMLYPNELEKILKKCRENKIHTAVDTAGCVPWESFEKILPYTDLFLYDVKCLSEDLHKQGTGVSNNLILSNLERLSAFFNGRIIVRIPIIPGFNDDAEELRKIAAFLKNINLTDVELLPYHKMGKAKYTALGLSEYSFETPDEEKLIIYRKYFL